MTLRTGKGPGGKTKEEHHLDERARLANEVDQMHAQTGHQMGLSLASWHKMRNALLEAALERRRILYGPDALLPSNGHELDNSQPWHREYTTMCANGLVAIKEGQIKPYALAELVLVAFSDVLSNSALQRWQYVADQGTQP